MTISAGEGLYIHTTQYGFLKWLACILAVGIDKKSPPQTDYRYTKKYAGNFFSLQDPFYKPTDRVTQLETAVISPVLPLYLYRGLVFSMTSSES